MGRKRPIREQCRELRLGAGLSMAKLAELCGVSTPCIAQFETGRGEPLLCTMEAYLKPLGYELGIRRSAMKPVRKRGRDVRHVDVYECPACGQPFSGTGVCNYCYRCGQEIDWTEGDGEG